MINADYGPVAEVTIADLHPGLMAVVKESVLGVPVKVTVEEVDLELMHQVITEDNL